MRRTFTLLAAAALVLSLAGAADAKSCKDASGKFTKCPAAAAAPAAKPAAAPAATPAAAPAAKPAAATATKTASASGPKNCKKGKACGNSCISVNDVCHK